MKKKQIIGLGTLLLVLLLGLFTTSYADVNRTWTDTELKNIIFKMGMNKNANYESDYINLIDSKTTEISDIVNIINQYNYIYIGCNNYDTLIIKISNTNNRNWYVYRNQAVINTSYDSWYRVYRINLSSSQLTISYNASDTSSWELNNYRYTSKNVYTSGTGGNLVWSAGSYNPTTFFDEWYYQDSMPFIFIAKPSDTYASVWSYDDVPFYNASGEDLYIGQLFVPDGTVIEENNLNFYYRFGTWNHRYLPDGCYYLDYYSSDNDVNVYDVYLSKQFIYENTLYDLTISDKSVEPYNLAPIFFYIRNNYTVIANGVLDASSTFSGDYKEQYDNEIQNEQDINNISEAIIGTILDDSEVDNILHNFDTSGEVAAYFGYHDYTSDNDSPFYKPSLLITSVVESLIDELMRSGDRYVDITLPNGEQERIWARFFTTPDEGRGSALILFVRWYLIFVTIYLMYRNLLEIGEEFTTFNVHGALDKIDVDRYVFRM